MTAVWLSEDPSASRERTSASYALASKTGNWSVASRSTGGRAVVCWGFIFLLLQCAAGTGAAALTRRSSATTIPVVSAFKRNLGRNALSAFGCTNQINELRFSLRREPPLPRMNTRLVELLRKQRCSAPRRVRVARARDRAVAMETHGSSPERGSEMAFGTGNAGLGHHTRPLGQDQCEDQTLRRRSARPSPARQMPIRAKVDGSGTDWGWARMSTSKGAPSIVLNPSRSKVLEYRSIGLVG